MRRVTILGATGSIGQNTLDLIRRARNDYRVVALTGGRNLSQLAQDAVDLGAELAVTCHADLGDELAQRLAGTGIETAAGTQAVIDAAARPADWTMSAIVGAAGLAPGLAALDHGGTLALANKESLVAAGPLLMQTAQRAGATILPVDSEHSAIFQALRGEDITRVERILVTASGGAFRDWPIKDLAHATPQQAATHPNWSMGQRITIDSASMFNKALELIETKEFFGVSADQIQAVVHPESLIHALVGFVDGAMMAHVGAHDMRHAIGYALNWPERQPLPVPRLDLCEVGALTFRPACETRWPALRLARDVMQAGGLHGAVFNAAKETALDAFIAGQITFTRMPEVVEATLTDLTATAAASNACEGLETVLRVDTLARRTAQTYCQPMR